MASADTATATPVQSETIIVDADIPNPTSLLSGQSTSRTSNNSRRSVQRTSSKRFDNNSQIITPSVVSEESALCDSRYTRKPNILGGVVADKAFYSLCCLRI